VKIIYHAIWEKEAVPQELKDANIVHLYNKKETGPTVITVAACHYLLQLGKYSVESSPTDYTLL